MLVLTKHLDYKTELAAGRIKPVKYAIPDTCKGRHANPHDRVGDDPARYESYYRVSQRRHYSVDR